MKLFFIALSLLTLSAFAQNEPTTQTEDADAAYKRMLERKREKMGQKQEERREERSEEVKKNDDLDPSLDPIDDQPTRDEGMNDD